MPGYPHKVLVVDDNAQVGRTICTILEREALQSIHVPSGGAALETLKTADPPFSLIISSQGLPDMKGTELLEQAQNILPDTLRFLVTRTFEMQTIVDSVNKASVQRYIPKPWDDDKIIRAFRWAVDQYERVLDNEKVLALAKKQNGQLYELNCDLMEAAKNQSKEATSLDTEIESIEAQIKNPGSKALNSKALASQNRAGQAQVMEALEALVKPLGQEGQAVLNTLFFQTLNTLLKEFMDLALKNGFEMPEPLTGGGDE